MSIFKFGPRTGALALAGVAAMLVAVAVTAPNATSAATNGLAGMASSSGAAGGGTSGGTNGGTAARLPAPALFRIAVVPPPRAQMSAGPATLDEMVIVGETTSAFAAPMIPMLSAFSVAAAASANPPLFTDPGNWFAPGGGGYVPSGGGITPPIVVPPGGGISLPAPPPSAPSMVPEPQVWGMMLVGFGLIGLQVRSRGRRAVTS